VPCTARARRFVGWGRPPRFFRGKSRSRSFLHFGSPACPGALRSSQPSEKRDRRAPSRLAATPHKEPTMSAACAQFLRQVPRGLAAPGQHAILRHPGARNLDSHLHQRAAGDVLPVPRVAGAQSGRRRVVRPHLMWRDFRGEENLRHGRHLLYPHGAPILWFSTIHTATALTNFFIMESCSHFYT